MPRQPARHSLGLRAGQADVCRWGAPTGRRGAGEGSDPGLSRSRDTRRPRVEGRLTGPSRKSPGLMGLFPRQSCESLLVSRMGITNYGGTGAQEGNKRPSARKEATARALPKSRHGPSSTGPPWTRSPIQERGWSVRWASSTALDILWVLCGPRLEAVSH